MIVLEGQFGLAVATMMAKVLAVVNQKGGVGKTTSSVNVAHELASLGRKVLLIDMDPQANASSGLGVPLHAEGSDLYDLFTNATPLSSLISKTAYPNLDMVPSSRDLIGIEVVLGASEGREYILRKALDSVRSNYEFVLIDCPPSSGLLVLNALCAAEGVLVPLQAEYYALEGISALMATVSSVKESVNPNLAVTGVFLTMFDARTKLCSEVEKEAREFFGGAMFDTKIPRNVRISEAPSHGLPISKYDPSSAGARCYRALALEIDLRVIGVSPVVAPKITPNEVALEEITQNQASNG